MEDELLPPPPKKVSNEVEEDFLLPPPPKKKIIDSPSLPNFSTNVTQTYQTPLKSQSPLVSNLKSVSEKKEKQINPFTASKQELEATYGKDYNKQENLNRQKKYTQGLQNLSKRVDSLIPQYEIKVSELDQLDAQLEQLKQDPNAYNQAIQVRNQKVGEVVKLADSLRAEKEKADIYEKGLSAVDVLRRSNEDTFTNRTNAAFNTLGIMGTTMLPTIARGAKVIDSYLQSKAMGLNEQEAELYQKAQTEITKKNWKGLTDVAREFYDKNQILEGGFSKESGYEKIKEGDYKAAGSLLAKVLVLNLAVTLGIGASFVNPLLGASFTIGGTAGAELQDMDINSPQMSEQSKIANAFVKGGSEYVTEKIFGTFNYLGRIAGGSIKSQAGKKMLLGSVKEAYEQVAKRFGLGADVIEEVSTEMLNKIVGDYTDYASGKTSELDFKKGLGETITTALSTSLLLGGAGRAAKYGSKKIDELRAKAKQLQTTIEDPSIKPEIANAVKEEVLNINQQIGDEAAKSKATYDALPEEKQDRVDALVEEKTSTENILQDPQLPQEIKPSVEEKLNIIQSEIDNEYKSVDKSLIKTEENKLEEIINEPTAEVQPIAETSNKEEKPKENKTTTTPSSSNNSEVSALGSVEEEFTKKGGNKIVDKDGIPLILYHGTSKGLKASDLKQSGQAGDYGEGIYFTTDKSEAEQRNPENIIEANLKSDKHLVIGSKEYFDGIYKDLEKKYGSIIPRYAIGIEAKKAGYTSMEVERPDGKWVIAFDGVKIREKTNEPTPIEANIPTSNKGTQTTEPTIKEGEGQVESEKVFTYDKEGGIIEATVISKGKDTTSILVNGKQTVRANTEIFSNKKEAEDRIAKEIIDPEIQKRDNLVNDLSTYNKLTKAAKASSKGVKMLNGIKTRATEMGFTTRENKGKLEVINVNGKRLTKSRITEEVTEPTQEARDNFKKLFKEGVIVPSIVSQTLEPTQIRVAIEAFKNGKETKDVKRLMNEFADFNEDTDVKYREWDGNKWVGFSVPLSEMLIQEVDVDNLTEKEINELADIYDDMFADTDEQTKNFLTNLFYEEQENRQQDQSEDSTSSKSSTKAKGTTQSEKVVKAVEKILENELESNGSLSKSAVIRTQKRNTAVKQVKSELDTKEAKAVETVIANYDKIRDILIDNKMIKAIDCKWAKNP